MEVGVVGCSCMDVREGGNGGARGARETKGATAQPHGPVLPSLREVVAGSAAGVAICLVGHPLDTVKVVL